MMKWILAVTVLFGSATLSHGLWHSDLCEGFVPENDLYIPVTDTMAFGRMTEEQFNSTLDRVEGIYKNEVAAKGGALTINRLWDNGTVNANAMRFGKSWQINMYGGLARHNSITPDGFALVACHELGHHLGGAPKVGGFVLNKWATNEGASDYFATLKCLRRVFEGDDNERIVADLKLDPVVVSTCEEQHGSRRDQLLCIRGAHAGLSVAGLFHALSKQKTPLNFASPDPKKVKKTYAKHPNPQCRLDTYLQGAVCKVAVEEPLSERDYHKGSCADARVYTAGLRPRCWFKPNKKDGQKFLEDNDDDSGDENSDEVVTDIAGSF